MPLLNPLLVAMAATFLFVANRYSLRALLQRQREVLNDLLQLAVVALAYPLYEQLHQIRARWKPLASVLSAVW